MLYVYVYIYIYIYIYIYKNVIFRNTGGNVLREKKHHFGKYFLLNTKSIYIRPKGPFVGPFGPDEGPFGPCIYTFCVSQKIFLKMVFFGEFTYYLVLLLSSAIT